MIPESYFQQIEEHLAVVEQLAIEVRQTADSGTNGLINAIAKLFDKTVKAIQPLIALVETEQISQRYEHSSFRQRDFRAVRLEMPLYNSNYREVPKFDKVLLTVDGKVAFPDKRLPVSDPWYFVYYDLGGSWEDRFKFYLDFLSAIREFLKSNYGSIISANKSVDEVLGKVEEAQNIFQTAS